MKKKTIEKRPFYKRWWFITIVAFLILGVMGNIIESDESKVDQNINNVTTITPDEFNKLKKGMSYDEVVKVVGGKAKTNRTNQFDEKLVTYDYDGEKGVSADSKVSLLFNDGKLDVIMEFGLLESK